jgi:hypothetical protein
MVFNECNRMRMSIVLMGIVISPVQIDKLGLGKGVLKTGVF